MELKSKQKNYKKENYFQLLLLLIILISLNVLLNLIYIRLDLTSEKRYTLTETTKNLLKNLHKEILIKIYLSGDLPYNFKHLQISIKEMLDEFISIAKEKIQYRFIDINKEYKSKKERNEVIKQLINKGLIPFSIEEKEADDKIVQRFIFPGAIISSGDKEIIINFFSSNSFLPPELRINQSIEDIEYNLTYAIRQIIGEFTYNIAFIEGQGEYDEKYVADFVNSLAQNYNVERIRLNEKIFSLSTRVYDSINNKVDVFNKYDLIIIAGPDSSFTEKNKYIIDQFIMYGGKAIFLIDGVYADMDSLAFQNSFIAHPKDLNLGDMLFKYGVRVNYNLVQSIHCGLIPLNSSPPNTPPNYQFFPWIYLPFLLPNENHPIGKNVGIVKGQFVSSVDPVGDNPEIKKTIILSSSEFSRIINSPVKISLSQIKLYQKKDLFQKSLIPVGILLEGNFESVYKYRLSPNFVEQKELAFKDQSFSTKIAVIGDANIIRNDIKRIGLNYTPLPLGFDKYTNQTFSNKLFLLNLVNYMLDPKNFSDLKSKSFQLRLINKNITEKYKNYIILINFVIPMLITIFSGLLIILIRKKRYGVKKN